MEHHIVTKNNLEGFVELLKKMVHFKISYFAKKYGKFIFRNAMWTDKCKIDKDKGTITYLILTQMVIELRQVEYSNCNQKRGGNNSMSLELTLTLLGLLFITVGSIFYFISLLMERYYDRKLYELEQKQKGKIK